MLYLFYHNIIIQNGFDKRGREITNLIKLFLKSEDHATEWKEH